MALINLPDPEQLASRILRGVREAVASGLNLLDNRLAEARNRSARLLASLSGERQLKEGHLVGVTGPPGAGKSSLINALLAQLAHSNKIAVLSIDPSSPFNLGALLGDRIRMNDFYLNPHVFIRSMASRGSLGGLCPSVIEVTELLKAAPFDYIFLETVGVGQSEIEIS